MNGFCVSVGTGRPTAPKADDSGHGNAINAGSNPVSRTNFESEMSMSAQRVLGRARGVCWKCADQEGIITLRVGDAVQFGVSLSI